MEKTQIAVTSTSENLTQVISAPGAEATQMAISVTCPVCKAITAGGENYCADCGFLLSSVPAESLEIVSLPVLPKLVDVSTGRESLLNPGANTIGRENADVLISHPTVSRQHAKLTVTEDGFVLEDVGSINGTFAGDQRLEHGESISIEPETEIRIGSVTMRLEVPQPDAEPSNSDDSEPSETVGSEVATLESVDAERDVDAEEQTSPVEELPNEADETLQADTDSETEEETESPTPDANEPHEEPQVLAELLPTADGEAFALVSGENSVGRRPSNSIVLADPYVSGSHATITAEDAGFVLIDLNSTNGTSVNGQRLTAGEPHTLSDGDEVVFGQMAFRFAVQTTE